MDVDIQTKEIISVVTNGGGFTNPEMLVVSVPSSLPNKTIWLYMWASTSNTADYGLSGALKLYDPAGDVVGNIPVAIGISATAGTTKFQKSLACFVSAGGSPVADSLGLILVAPVLNQPISGVLLQPFYCKATAFKVVLAIDQALNITDARFWMAVRSQR